MLNSGQNPRLTGRAGMKSVPLRFALTTFVGAGWVNPIAIGCDGIAE
jgi:hypothetical protein